MQSKLLVNVGVLSGALLFVCTAVAERYSFVGHRAQGMGGANAATVNDSSAQWHNPAAFGFYNRDPDPVMGTVTNAITNVVTVVTNMQVTNVIAEVESANTNRVSDTEAADTNAVASIEGTDTNAAPEQVLSEYVQVTNETYEVTYEAVVTEIVPERALVDNANLQANDWGWTVFGIGAGYTMTEDMPEYITQLGLIDFEVLDGTGVDPDPDSVENILLLGSALYGLGSNPDNAFYVDTTAGMNFRFGHWGFGIRGFGEVAGFVDYLDTDNLGVEQTEAEFIAAINDAAIVDGFNAGTWTYQSIAPDSLNISGSPDGPQAEAYIDFQLTRLKNAGTINEQNIDDSVLMANLITYGQDPNSTNSTSFENNTSTVTARGFGLVEIPVSYGYAFSDNLSIGITAKGMYGTVTGTKVRFADGDSFDAALDTLEENTEASLNFGLDLGVLYRMKMFQFAAVAHNINAPEFSGFKDTIEIENDAGTVVDTVDIHIPDYTIDPQVTLGAAFIPSKRFMIEMSYDLLETGTLMENYDIRRISFGTELDIWLLAFRLGMYNNLAADWQDWIATGGLGLNLWAMRFDVGGAYSIGENTEYEGTEIPEEARVYAALSMEF